jgi:heme/copper-type cytochrome/quinol oxidase subunit 3
MKLLSNLTFPTRLTAGGLVACALSIWLQWLSGDPAYPKFPPGPVFFIAVAAIVALAARWWWTPLIGSLLSLLVTSGWFARLPQNMVRIAHPGSLGHFVPGIFLGSVGLILALLITDVAGLVATIFNYRRREHVSGTAKMVLRFFGGIFVLMGVVVIVSGLHSDRYHNLMHIIWGALAVAASFLTVKLARLFCIGSGLFYLALAILGLTIGDPSMGRAWQAGPMLLHTGDHIFHLVLGLVFLGFGLASDREHGFFQARSTIIHPGIGRQN